MALVLILSESREEVRGRRILAGAKETNPGFFPADKRKENSQDKSLEQPVPGGTEGGVEKQFFCVSGAAAVSQSC